MLYINFSKVKCRPIVNNMSNSALLKLKKTFKRAAFKTFSIGRRFIFKIKNFAYYFDFSTLRLHGLDPYFFDSDLYLDTYPQARETGLSAFKHFVKFGLYQGNIGYFFDNKGYLELNDDVKSTGLDGIDHFKLFGKSEHRDYGHIIVSIKNGSSRRNEYSNWLSSFEAKLRLPIEAQNSMIDAMKISPKISVIMPVYNPAPDHLLAAINSVIAQTYQNWELCIADDASTDPIISPLIDSIAKTEPRIKIIHRNKNGHISAATNSALKLASGEFIALLDQDDLLSDDALFWVAHSINANPNADIIYSDEDKIDDKGKRFSPYFKCDFNYDLFLSHNMISHLGIYRRTILKEIGGFRQGFEGSQDYDLALRAILKTEWSRIIHIPRILYHWRAIEGSTALNVNEKSYAIDAAIRALKEHLESRKISAEVEQIPEANSNFRVKYHLIDKPLVSIIIPTRDRYELLKTCVDSIFAKTTYPNYEIIIVDNGSEELDAIEYMERLPKDKTKIIRDNGKFNYARLNNLAASQANGKILVLLNNDIEIITPNWIEEMLGFAQQDDIGCVGARLWFPDNKIQHAGVVLGIGSNADHVHKNLPRGKNGYFGRAILAQSFSAVTAACLMVRKELYDAVGGLDLEFAVDFNDIDFCLRVGETGHRTVWTPSAQMYHYESATRGRAISAAQKARAEKEAALFQTRWHTKIKNDPAYNPNLSIDFADFSFAWPPRI